MPTKLQQSWNRLFQLASAVKAEQCAEQLGVAALALSNGVVLQAAAQEAGNAEDLGVMESNLKDAIKFKWEFQGALQGAGDSSLINTGVAGAKIITSTRPGYRWLNNERYWMIGVNAGYDSLPMNTGNTDTGVDVTGKRDIFFQQIAAGVEAVSESWNFNAYGLFTTGGIEQVLNDRYYGGAVWTYGLDVGYAITSEWNASIGCCYEHGDELTADDGSGVQASFY